MWVFGYGSLMWDSWERDFDSTDREVATLSGYCRDFNKASTKRWGSSDAPGLTLGLARSPDGRCEGVAFEFPESRCEEILARLRQREGPSFSLQPMPVRLSSGRLVTALVPVNDTTANSYIGDRPLSDRAKLAQTTRGEAGTSLEYVTGVHAKLQELEVDDPAVEEFWSLVSELEDLAD